MERRICLGVDWAFLDAVTAANCFRIDHAKVDLIDWPWPSTSHSTPGRSALPGGHQCRQALGLGAREERGRGWGARCCCGKGGCQDFGRRRVFEGKVSVCILQVHSMPEGTQNSGFHAPVPIYK